MTIWAPGMLCVCIDDDGFLPSTRGDQFIELPRRGIVYTVRAVVPDPFVDEDDLLLEEIRNPELLYFGIQGRREQSFNADRFRPVRSSSLDQFRAHLAPAPRDLVPA